jgi:hypothetical protein
MSFQCLMLFSKWTNKLSHFTKTFNNVMALGRATTVIDLNTITAYFIKLWSIEQHVLDTNAGKQQS